MSWFKNSPVPSLGSKRETIADFFLFNKRYGLLRFSSAPPSLFSKRRGAGGMSWFKNSPASSLGSKRETIAVFFH